MNGPGLPPTGGAPPAKAPGASGAAGQPSTKGQSATQAQTLGKGPTLQVRDAAALVRAAQQDDVARLEPAPRADPVRPPVPAGLMEALFGGRFARTDPGPESPAEETPARPIEAERQRREHASAADGAVQDHALRNGGLADAKPVSALAPYGTGGSAVAGSLGLGSPSSTDVVRAKGVRVSGELPTALDPETHEARTDERTRKAVEKVRAAVAAASEAGLRARTLSEEAVRLEQDAARQHASGNPRKARTLMERAAAFATSAWSQVAKALLHGAEARRISGETPLAQTSSAAAGSQPREGSTSSNEVGPWSPSPVAGPEAWK